MALQRILLSGLWAMMTEKWCATRLYSSDLQRRDYRHFFILGCPEIPLCLPQSGGMLGYSGSPQCLVSWSIQHHLGQKYSRSSSTHLCHRFEEAVRQYTVNVGEHMFKIKEELESQEGPEDTSLVSRKEELLDELMEIVENIDHAKGQAIIHSDSTENGCTALVLSLSSKVYLLSSSSTQLTTVALWIIIGCGWSHHYLHFDVWTDLTSIGGIETLMALLRDRHASIRWRAAEVAATCAQNNAPVQDWLLRSGCLPKLLKLLEDADATCRSVMLVTKHHFFVVKRMHGICKKRGLGSKACNCWSGQLSRSYSNISNEFSHGGAHLSSTTRQLLVVLNARTWVVPIGVGWSYMPDIGLGNNSLPNLAQAKRAAGNFLPHSEWHSWHKCLLSRGRNGLASQIAARRPSKDQEVRIPSEECCYFREALFLVSSLLICDEPRGHHPPCS